MFDDIIKGKANEHEAPVPPDAWDNIARKKKKRRFGFWWWGSALLLLMALSTGGYFLLNKKTNTAIAGTEANKNVQAREKTNEQNIPAKATEEESKTNASFTLENKEPTTAAGESNIAATDLINKKQPLRVSSNPKIKLTTQRDMAEENDIKTADRNIKSKTIKCRLNTQQTNGETDELITANNEEKANNSEIITPAEDTKETEEMPEEKIASVNPVEVKTVTAIEEKKVTATEKNNTEVKKTSTAVAKLKAKKHWFIEAAAIPLIATSHYNKNISFNRTITLNNSSAVYKANLINASIEPAISFSLLARRQVNKKIAVGTGLQYMLLKETMTMEGKETNTAYNVISRLVNGRLVPDTFVSVTEGTRSISAVNSYQLFSIPIFVEYNIIQKTKWSVGAVGGFYFNISGNYKNEINRNATAPLLPAPGTINKSNTGMDIFAGIRIGKKLTQRLDFFVMPSMRWSLARYNIKNSLLDKNINQAGVGFGMCYKIKNLLQ